MRELIKQIKAVVLSWDELSVEEKWILERAWGIRENAQAPYSHYKVGAAILAISGGRKVHSLGCNVERCSYTQTTHAEQNAIDTAVARGCKQVVAVAIVGALADKKIDWPPDALTEIADIKDVPVPCGHCLQIIWENCYGDPNVKLLALAPNDEIVRTTIGDALPMRFGPESIGVKI